MILIFQARKGYVFLVEKLLECVHECVHECVCVYVYVSVHVCMYEREDLVAGGVSRLLCP